jgi:hypothetical protein
MIFDAEGIVFVALFLFWIWALLDCISTDAALCRNLPKPMWIILVLILPDIGSLLWLLLGRPERSSWRPGSTDYAAPRRPVGLEDSPRYSGTPSVTDRRSEELDRELERWERERQAKEAPAAAPAPATANAVNPELVEWQQQLDQREADLKRRELELREKELDRVELEQRARELDD